MITPLTACLYLNSFQRYSRSNSIAVLNRAEFWTFFAFPTFKRAVPPKVVHSLLPLPSGKSRAKVYGATPFSSKDLEVHTLHCKAIFDPPFVKNVGGTPVPGGVCAGKPWTFYTSCKNFGAQHPLGAVAPWAHEVASALGGRLCGHRPRR